MAGGFGDSGRALPHNDRESGPSPAAMTSEVVGCRIVASFLQYLG
jgi:hypothetical protein